LLLLEQEQEQEQEQGGDLEWEQLFFPDEISMLNEDDWPLYMALLFFFLK
jgi:hypothetical protein